MGKSMFTFLRRQHLGLMDQSVDDAKESFGDWSEEMLMAINRCGYKAPAIRRVYIPKPGKAEKRQ